MKSEKEMWVAKDLNVVEWNAYENEPSFHKDWKFWFTEKGKIIPMQMFSDEIDKYCSENNIDTSKPFKIKISIEI